jgi:Holliday junction resolvasome RuvABC endonuclease subunit
MKHPRAKHMLVLGIAPSSRGFGFAVIEGENTLVNWGVKSVKSGDKNARSLSNAGNLMAQYQPDVIAITGLQGSRRGPRVQALANEIVTLAQEEKIKVRRFSRKQVNLGLLGDGQVTKQILAEHLGARFPEELSFRLPRKRRAWTNEDYQMDIFEAVALALAVRSREEKRCGSV